MPEVKEVQFQVGVHFPTAPWIELSSAWKTIAEDWALIRITKWMERDSAEYKIYEAHCLAELEGRERAEFELREQKFWE